MLRASSGRQNFEPLTAGGGSTQDYVLSGFDADCGLVADEQVVLAMLQREEALRRSGAVQYMLDARGQSSGELIYRALQQHV